VDFGDHLVGVCRDDREGADPTTRGARRGSIKGRCRIILLY
jgi:hypothetical protein